MIHDRGLQRGKKKTWIDKIVVCGGGSGERRGSPRGLRRWSGGVDEREKQMLPIGETTERVREMRWRRRQEAGRQN
jgi:hypothetical protein